MQRMELMAAVCVGRGCGFAALAIATFMLALYGNPAACLKTGGMMTVIVTLVLVMKGLQARGRPYEDTELWIMLPPDQRPQDAIAQAIIGAVLQRTYLTFALHTARLAAFMLFAVLIMHAGHVER